MDNFRGAQKNLIGKIKSHHPRTATFDQVPTMSSKVDVLTHAEPSAHRSSSWLCSWNSQHAWHTDDSRHTGDSAAPLRACPSWLPRTCSPPAGGTSASAASSRRCSTIRHPRSLRPFGACPRPRCFFCVKRVYDSPSAVLESALTR